VSVINSATNAVIVGTDPDGLAVSPTGANAGDVYVTNSGSNSVSVISPSNTVLTTITVGRLLLPVVD
jgi:YVTN family beta-propeller protein